MAIPYAFNENTAAAKRLFDKVGGFDRFTPDLFDTFIIDEGFAADPGTDDTKSPAYRGFVQQRSQTRKKLNTAARNLQNGQAYNITIIQPGKIWELRPWADRAEDAFHDIGSVVRRFSENKVAELKSLRNQAEAKFQAGDASLWQIIQMQGMLTASAMTMQSRIMAETVRYETAYESAKNFAMKLLENGKETVAIEDMRDTEVEI